VLAAEGYARARTSSTLSLLDPLLAKTCRNSHFNGKIHGLLLNRPCSLRHVERSCLRIYRIAGSRINWVLNAYVVTSANLQLPGTFLN